MKLVTSAPPCTVAEPTGSSWPLTSRAEAMGPAKLHVHVRRGLAVEFHHAQHHFVALLGLLQSHHADARIVDLEQRELLAQRAGVLGRFEGDQRIVQALALPIGLRRAPVARVAGDAEEDFVMSPILVELVGVAGVAPGRAHQGQADGVVVELVRAVLARRSGWWRRKRRSDR